MPFLKGEIGGVFFFLGDGTPIWGVFAVARAFEVGLSFLSSLFYLLLL
jgi:hypothetical protein